MVGRSRVALKVICVTMNQSFGSLQSDNRLPGVWDTGQFTYQNSSRDLFCHEPPGELGWPAR